MWAKKENERDVAQGNLFSTWLRTIIHYAIVALRYTFLIAFLILLASHEAGNPKFGKTSIEFFSDEFRQEMIRRNMAEASCDTCLNSDNSLIGEFYRLRQYLPAWTINFETNMNYKELIGLIGSSYHFGMLPSSYFYDDLQAYEYIMLADQSEEKLMQTRIELERTATLSAIRFMKHIATGHRTADTTAGYQAYLLSIPARLNQFLVTGDIQGGMEDLQPDNPQYQRLQRALSRYIYRALDDTMRYDPDELAGDNRRIAERLVKQGYMDPAFLNDTVALETALRNFQKTHHLEITGIADRQTIEQLRVGTRDKFYRIALNLDRIRRDELNTVNCILVNIPEFRLRYYNSHGEEKAFNVIVGKTSSPTPLLSSELDRIVTNPHWTVPRSIAHNEIIPLIKKDSMYLQKHGFTVVDNGNNEVDASSIDWHTVNGNDFDYWIRQTKINNALGVVKFLFPNNYSVYLHDTQSKRLFNRQVRAYSHGCVRVQDPQELAQLLVAEYATQQEDIGKLIRNRERKEIKMERPVAVHIRYYSCTADSAGNIYYHPDIYALDENAIAELFANGRWN